MRHNTFEPTRHFVRRQQERIRKRLVQECQRLLTDIEMEVPRQETKATGDFADMAEIESKVFLLSHSPTWESLRQIDHALNMLDEGKYGLCERCGRAISLARLKAIPWTCLCKRCRAEEEVQPHVRTEPLDFSFASDVAANADESTASHLECEPALAADRVSSRW